MHITHTRAARRERIDLTPLRAFKARELKNTLCANNRRHGKRRSWNSVGLPRRFSAVTTSLRINPSLAIAFSAPRRHASAACGKPHFNENRFSQIFARARLMMNIKFFGGAWIFSFAFMPVESIYILQVDKTSFLSHELKWSCCFPKFKLIGNINALINVSFYCISRLYFVSINTFSFITLFRHVVIILIECLLQKRASLSTRSVNKNEKFLRNRRDCECWTRIAFRIENTNDALWRRPHVYLGSYVNCDFTIFTKLSYLNFTCIRERN